MKMEGRERQRKSRKKGNRRNRGRESKRESDGIGKETHSERER